jgi:ABC-type sugar transport system ATPase subunit
MGEMDEHVLEAVNISKEFPGVQALKDVSIWTRKHEVLGLIGENGAGKSTILKIINGIYKEGTFEGNLLLRGQPISFKSPHDALLKGIGYVPQEINVMDDLTVAENIFVGHLKATGEKTLRLNALIKRAGHFLRENKFDLDPSMRVNLLSVGQKQLLMIARALSWSPSVLILDEPTTALSQNDVEKLFVIIENLKSQGTSVIFVTHKLEEIFALTDRVAVLRDGALIATYHKHEYDKDTIISAMVGRKITNLYPTRQGHIGEEVLRVEGLTVDHPRLQNRTLIHNVSFSVREGEVLGIAGLVGAGRTETLSAIFGQYPLKSGRIIFYNKEVKIRNEADALRQGLSYVTEDRKGGGLLMLGDIKTNIVLSNLKKIRNGIFLNKKKESALADEYMERLHIKAPTHKAMVVNLSGGNQQKVVLAKSLNTHPKVLMLDEPTKGIDVGSKNEIYMMINDLAQMGVAVIIVSSELPEILAMCDRFVVMAHGTVVGELNKEEATQEAVIGLCFS